MSRNVVGWDDSSAGQGPAAEPMGDETTQLVASPGFVAWSDCDAHTVTVRHDVLSMVIKMARMDLTELPFDRLRMLDRDAKAAGFSM